MNRDEQIILNYYYKGIKQRELSTLSNLSLGKVNNILKRLKKNKYIIDDDINKELLNEKKIHTAIILAAGFALRMMPINKECPKALLTIRNEILIERLINQLKERDINNIYIIVGFQKEKFEYLIDKYNVKLLVNENYMNDNNLLSLFKASKYIPSSYIVPGDLYLNNNIFNLYEDKSWYSLSNKKENEGYYYTNRDKKLIKGRSKYYDALGVAYISKEDAPRLIENMNILKNNNIPSYWEDALFIHDKEIKIDARHIDRNSYHELNNVNDLLFIDRDSNNLNNDNINLIKKVFNCSTKDIKNVSISKKGMTNKSFTFEIKNKKYIMRIPGEGTSKLINRKEEYAVYQLISPIGISDKVIYMNPLNGIKITEYIYNSHNCDISNWKEISLCMKKLKQFHSLKLHVDFIFDLFKQIDYYESLRGDTSLYSDYLSTKEECLKLKEFVNKYKKEYQLCHIDSVPDNFMINKEGIRLIDWEYSASQDPDLDIAMFIIYAGYSREEADKLINIYYENNIEEIIRMKIYSYIALAGLLWSNWCEYKHTLGIEFGEYSLNQYRYAKEYSRIVNNYIKENAVL